MTLSVCVCVYVCGGVSPALHLPFSISISHPSVFHWERRGASDGSGREWEQKNPKSKHSIIGAQ